MWMRSNCSFDGDIWDVYEVEEMCMSWKSRMNRISKQIINRTSKPKHSLIFQRGPFRLRYDLFELVQNVGDQCVRHSIRVFVIGDHDRGQSVASHVAMTEVFWWVGGALGCEKKANLNLVQKIIRTSKTTMTRLEFHATISIRLTLLFNRSSRCKLGSFDQHFTGEFHEFVDAFGWWRFKEREREVNWFTSERETEKLNSKITTNQLDCLPVLLKEPKRSQINSWFQDDHLICMLVTDGEKKQFDHDGRLSKKLPIVVS